MVVIARNVSFSYSNTKVLDNVNLHIPQGIIYALLGPSGCGKTTLLRTITGRLPLKDDGEVFVFGQKPFTSKSLVPGPDIGCMAQDIALDGQLTISETLCLYGKLCGMTQRNILNRIQELIKVLELPNSNKFINTLSGGQQRRVSLAVALIHQPPLIILDEPTVGVDPMLRKKIWSHLVNITTSMNTTVIITTHYIDEAKDANMIAAMRNGRILIEANPVSLMKTLNCDDLESCFVRICEFDTGNDELKMIKDKLLSVSNGNSIDLSNHSLKTYVAPPSFTSRQKTLCKRNLIIIKRNLFFMAFNVLLPFIEMIFFCLTLSKGLYDLPVAVVNEDGPTGLGQQYISHLDNNVLLPESLDYNNAIDSVARGRNYAYVRIGKNFTECFNRKLSLGLDVGNDTYLCGSVLSQFDLSNQQIFYVVYATFVSSYQAFFKEVIMDRGISPLVARWPIDMSDPIFGSLTPNGEHFLCAIVVFILFYIGSIISLLKTMEEKGYGVVETLWISRVSKTDLFISHYLCNIVVALAQASICLLYVYAIFGLPVRGSVWAMILMGLSQSISGLACGFLISSLFDNSSTALMCGNFIMIANLFLSGVFWPIEAMPSYFKVVSRYIPVTMPILAFRAIVIKGQGFDHHEVLLGFLSSYVWFAIFVIISILRVKFSR